MKAWVFVIAVMIPACKQASVASSVAGEDDRELPGPEVFENGPSATCDADGVRLTITFGPPGDYKWARLTDAPVPDGNPRVEYLQSDSSRIRKTKEGQLVSGRWHKAVPGSDPIEAKVFLDSQPADCQLSGFVKKA